MPSFCAVAAKLGQGLTEMGKPLHIIPAIFVWIKSAKKMVVCYHFANFAVILLTMALWALLPQCANAAFFPLMAALAVRSLSYLLTARGKK